MLSVAHAHTHSGGSHMVDAEKAAEELEQGKQANLKGEQVRAARKTMIEHGHADSLHVTGHRTRACARVRRGYCHVQASPTG